VQARTLILGVIVIVAVVLLVILLPSYLVPLDGLTVNERSTHIATTRTSLVQLAAAAGLLLGLLFTASTLRLNREGHITDRFGKAVDQLGSEALETRIGGVYALERIMRDSPVDHGPIVEILAAFVREHAVDRGPADQPASPVKAGPPVPGLPPIRADVQAAVTVLARRPKRAESGPLDLRDVDLRGVRARTARFAGAILTNAKLDYSDLGEVDLRAARLRNASLHSAWLRAANLQDASLRHANLSYAYLGDVNWRNADLENVDQTGIHR
jgi:hypothetical protein